MHGIPKHVLKRSQSVQNAVARVATLARKRDHVTPVLKELHWLPVQERVIFKILLLTYKALNNLTPSYISELVKRYIPSRNLRSSTSNRLVKVPYNLKTYGFRAFSSAAPALWNELPQNIRCCSSVNEFKQLVKTHLFKKAF